MANQKDLAAALQVSPAEMASAKNAENINNATVYRRLGDYDALFDAITLHRSAMYVPNGTVLRTYSVFGSTGAIRDKAWINGEQKPYLPVLELLF